MPALYDLAHCRAGDKGNAPPATRQSSCQLTSGRVIAAGSIQRSKSPALTRPSASAASRSDVPSRCAFCAIYAEFS